MVGRAVPGPGTSWWLDEPRWRAAGAHRSRRPSLPASLVLGKDWPSSVLASGSLPPGPRQSPLLHKHPKAGAGQPVLQGRTCTPPQASGDGGGWGVRGALALSSLAGSPLPASVPGQGGGKSEQRAAALKPQSSWGPAVLVAFSVRELSLAVSHPIAARAGDAGDGLSSDPGTWVTWGSYQISLSVETFLLKWRPSGGGPQLAQRFEDGHGQGW